MHVPNNWLRTEKWGDHCALFIYAQYLVNECVCNQFVGQFKLEVTTSVGREFQS